MIPWLKQRPLYVKGLTALVLVMAAVVFLVVVNQQPSMYERLYQRGEYATVIQQLTHRLENDPDWHEGRKLLVKAQLAVRGNPVDVLDNLLLLYAAGQDSDQADQTIQRIVNGYLSSAGLDVLNRAIASDPTFSRARELKTMLRMQITLGEAETTWRMVNKLETLPQALEFALFMERNDWVDDVLITFSSLNPTLTLELLPRMLELLPNEPRLIVIQAQLAQGIEGLEILINAGLTHQAVLAILNANKTEIIQYLNTNPLPDEIEQELAQLVGIFPAFAEINRSYEIQHDHFDYLHPYVEDNPLFKLHYGFSLLARGQQQKGAGYLTALTGFTQLADRLLKGHIVVTRPMSMQEGLISHMYLVQDEQLYYQDGKVVYRWQDGLEEAGKLELTQPLMWSPLGRYAYQLDRKSSTMVLYSADLTRLEVLTRRFDNSYDEAFWFEDSVLVYCSEDYPQESFMYNFESQTLTPIDPEDYSDYHYRYTLPVISPDISDVIFKWSDMSLTFTLDGENMTVQLPGRPFAVGREHIYVKYPVTGYLLMLQKLDFTGEIVSELPFFWPDVWRLDGIWNFEYTFYY